jgi:hypothetical protein
MITSIVIPHPLLFKSFLPPLVLHIKSKSPFQAATAKQNNTTDKKKYKEKTMNQKSHIDNLFFPSFA